MIGDVVFDANTLLYSAFAVIIGFQCVLFSVLARVYAISNGLLPDNEQTRGLVKIPRLGVSLTVGLLLILGGLGVSGYALSTWRAHHFGPLDYPHTMRLVIPAGALLVLGFQLVLARLFLEILTLGRR
jgi:hypothetical protein